MALALCQSHLAQAESPASTQEKGARWREDRRGGSHAQPGQGSPCWELGPQCRPVPPPTPECEPGPWEPQTHGDRIRPCLAHNSPFLAQATNLRCADRPLASSRHAGTSEQDRREEAQDQRCTPEMWGTHGYPGDSTMGPAPSAPSPPGLPPLSGGKAQVHLHGPQGPVDLPCPLPALTPSLSPPFPCLASKGNPAPSSWSLIHLLVMFLEPLPDLLQLQRNNSDHTGRWSMEVGKSAELNAVHVSPQLYDPGQVMLPLWSLLSSNGILPTILRVGSN